MNLATRDWLSSILQLVRFTFWYSVGVAFLFLMLPKIGLFLEGQYDSLTSSVKFAGILGFFIVAAVWHVIDTRKRWSRKGTKMQNV